MSKIDEILNFWFGDINQNPASYQEKVRIWFAKDPEFDQQIKQRFLSDIQLAASGEYRSWADHARGRLALILLLDQFSRNCFRDSPNAFAQDPLAQALTLEGIAAKQDQALSLYERMFFYIPLEHSENQTMHEMMLELTTELIEQAPEDQKQAFQDFHHYAVLHKNIIDKFGRYPHRNKVLQRESSPEEIKFLQTPNSSF